MKDKSLISGRFTLRLYLAALILTGVVFGVLSGNLYYSHRTSREMLRRELQLKELSGTIMHLDEVLTMSARMAAATGDTRWEDRYRHYERKLDVAIKEAMRLAPDLADSYAAAQTDVANTKLVQMENEAFKAVRDGRLNEAQALLSSDAYEVQKRIYADGMERFVNLLRNRVDTTLFLQQNWVMFSAVLIIGALPLLLFAWLVVLWSLRRWQRLVEESKHVVERHLKEVEAANKALGEDIAERKHMELALRESEGRLELVARATNDAIWDWDLATNQVWWNEGIHALFGYASGQVGPEINWWVDHLHPSDKERVVSSVKAVVDGGGEFWSAEYRYQKMDGSYAYVYDRGYVLRDSSGKPIRMIGAMVDISDRKQFEEQLLHDAFHDSTTGLPNRALFMDRLGRSIGRGKRRPDYLFAVLFADVDRFKVINDSLGHGLGDQLLISVAQRLQTSLRPSDTLARFGGDKFTILLEDIGDASDATRVADRIQKELTVPFNLSGQEVFMTVSIGIAQSASGHGRPEDILRDAETAMYRAKALGRARYQVFDTAMHARAVSLLRLETDLRRAVERQDFLLHYQPIVSLKTGRLIGFEALVRWRQVLQRKI